MDDEMAELETYAGDKYRCDRCCKRFKANETVMFSPGANLIFCEVKNPDDNCVLKYALFYGLAVAANAMKFHGNT